MSGKEGASTDTANQKPNDAAGAAGDGAAGDEDEDEEDEDPDAGKTPEQLAKELRDTRAALKRANSQARKARLEKKQTEVRPDADAEIKKLTRDLKVRDAAEALLNAGFNGEPRAARRAVKTFDSLDDGDLESEIEAYKDEFPAMFKKRKGRVATPDGVSPGAGNRQLNGTDDKHPELSAASKAMLGLNRRG